MRFNGVMTFVCAACAVGTACVYLHTLVQAIRPAMAGFRVMGG